MVDPFTANQMGLDHQRELVQQAERARALRAARSAAKNGNQPGLRARIQGIAARILRTRASDRPADQSEPACEDQSTAA